MRGAHRANRLHGMVYSYYSLHLAGILSKTFASSDTARADPGFFLEGGALVSCSTSTPINPFFFAEYQLY